MRKLEHVGGSDETDLYVDGLHPVTNTFCLTIRQPIGRKFLRASWFGTPDQLRALIEALEKAEQEVKKNLTVKKGQL